MFFCNYPDLLTGKEAAHYLRVTDSKFAEVGLAHGWGPKPLANYEKPVWYNCHIRTGFL